MKNITKYILLSLVATFTIMSCDKDFEEYNKNVDNPITVPSSMLIGTIVRDAANELYSTFNGSEIGETWSQHISLIQYNDPDRYKPRVTSMDAMWNVFYRCASNANQMYGLALAEENKTNQGIALVLKAYSFHVLTDLYGDIPFSEALLGPSEGNFTPVYDRQQDVYAGIIAMLDQAIPLLKSGVGETNPDMDNLYAGDIKKWTKFAYSLKFRALMRISGKQDVSASLTEIVNSGYLFASNADEAKLVYLSVSPEANPIFESVVAGGRNEFKLAETFVNFLIDNSDPRLPVMAQPAAASGNYVGKPSGHEESPLPGYSYDDVSAIGKKYLKPEAPGYFISYSELLFLLAEAAKKGYIPGGDATAQTYYYAGIQNSMAENGVSDGYAAYIAIPHITYNTNDALKQIGEQKWVVLFCQGFEAWTEWRRTGFPELTPAVDGYINEIPSRLRYESTEVSVNGINYKAAVEVQGADALATKIWWMIK